MTTLDHLNGLRPPELKHLSALREVKTTQDFKAWVRRDLRFVLPHASLLATVGKALGLGSVPTHRISVDFPLNIIEELKNSEGSINDPMASSWFKTGKLRRVELSKIPLDSPSATWKNVLTRYGYRDVLFHGKVDHLKHWFVTFHINNIYDRDALSSGLLISQLVEEMANAAYRAVTSDPHVSHRSLLWNPISTLTPAEVHIIELIAKGLSNKEIARLRGVSDSTVKTQVSRTGAKLGATRRAEIVAIAMSILAPLPAQTIFHMDNTDSL